MDLSFEGFDFLIRKKYGYTEAPKEVPVEEKREKKSLLDCSLEEIADDAQKQKKTESKKLVWSCGIDDEKKQKRNGGEKERIVNLRVSNAMLQELAERAGVDMQAYDVKVQAIIKRSKYC